MTVAALKQVTRFAGAVVALIVAGASWAPVVRACSSMAPDPTFEGVPADGDEDVPTDVLPYYRYPVGISPTNFDGSEDAGPGRFTLTAADGTEIALTARTGDVWNFELVPEAALEPHTQYVLRGEWTTPFTSGPVADEVHFTTGEGPLTMGPGVPDAKLAHYHFDNDQPSSCDPPSIGTCISIADDALVTLATYIDGHHQDWETYGYRGSYFGSNLSGMQQATPFTCIELRTRALNGVLSEPLTLCGDDFPIQEVEKSDRLTCTAAGLGGFAPLTNSKADAADAGMVADAGESRPTPLSTELPPRMPEPNPPMKAHDNPSSAPAMQPAQSDGSAGAGCNTARSSSRFDLCGAVWLACLWIARRRFRQI
jgi:hypothetical protein